MPRTPPTLDYTKPQPKRPIGWGIAGWMILVTLFLIVLAMIYKLVLLIIHA